MMFPDHLFYIVYTVKTKTNLNSHPNLFTTVLKRE